MKQLISLALLLALAACSGNKTESTQQELAEWKEMDAYHLLMAEAFHPYKDSANLAPAKSLAKEMADMADQWVTAPLPEKVNNDDMKAKIVSVRDGSQGLLKLINENAADSVIAKSLSDLHNVFHEVQEGWYGGGKKEHEHH